MTGATPGMPVGSIAIRPAAGRDLDGIRQLAERTLPPTYVDTGLLDAAEIEGLIQGFWSAEYLASLGDDGLLWIAERGGSVVGVAEVGRLGEGAAILWKLYVDTELQGHGIGTRLLHAVRGEIWPDIERWYTEYVTGNEPAATFYAKHGFAFDRIEPDARPDVDATYTWCVRDAAAPIVVA